MSLSLSLSLFFAFFFFLARVADGVALRPLSAVDGAAESSLDRRDTERLRDRETDTVTDGN